MSSSLSRCPRGCVDTDGRGCEWNAKHESASLLQFRPKRVAGRHEAFIRMILDGPDKGRWVAWCEDCDWHIDPRPIDRTLGDAVQAHMREASRV